ncbi:MAG: hypothetical protein KDB23_04875 [Planctomycetales bacterium]|nr:hypothetical protein [Planctomycetales bacterium]
MSKRLMSRLLLCIVATCCLGCEPEQQDLGAGTDHFLAAQDAIAAGDKELAIKELDASIAAQPDAWAYFQRGRLLAEKGDDDKALADCVAGQQLDPEHTGLKWLRAELKKPLDGRFKGRNAEPPVGK